MRNNNFKLAVDVSSAKFKSNVLYWGAWLIDAIGSFMFGMAFNTMLFMTILTPLPFSVEAKMVLASLLGGFATFFVTNVVFVLWRNNYMNSDGTGQYWIAFAMTIITFLTSLAFTAVSFSLLGFPHLFNEGTLTMMEAAGSLGFIALTVSHLGMAALYREFDPEVEAKRNAVTLNTKVRAEQSRILKKVTDDGITNGAARAMDSADHYADLYAQQFGTNLLAVVEDTMPSTQRVLPAPQAPPKREQPRPERQDAPTPPMRSTATSRARFHPDPVGLSLDPAAVPAKPQPSTNGHHAPRPITDGEA